MVSRSGKSGRVSAYIAVYQGPRKCDSATFAQMGTFNHVRVNTHVECLKSKDVCLKHFLN